MQGVKWGKTGRSGGCGPNRVKIAGDWIYMFTIIDGVGKIWTENEVWWFVWLERLLIVKLTK